MQFSNYSKLSLIFIVFILFFYCSPHCQEVDYRENLYSISGIANKQIERALSGEQSIASIVPLIETLHLQDPIRCGQIVSELLLSEHCKQYTRDWAILSFYKNKYELDQHFNNEELELLEKSIEECIEFFSERAEKIWLAKCYSLRSNILFNISFNNGDSLYTDALKYNELALKLMLDHQNDIQSGYPILGDIYRIKGNIGFKKKNYPIDSVLIHYDLAQEYFSLSKDKSGQAKVSMNKAMTYFAMERDTTVYEFQEDPAIYYEQAIKLGEYPGDLLSARKEFAIYLQKKYRNTRVYSWHAKSNEQLHLLINQLNIPKADAYAQLAANMQTFISFSDTELSKSEEAILMDSLVYFYENGLTSSQKENNLKIYNELFSNLTTACPYLPIEECSRLLKLLKKVKIHFIQKNKEINQKITSRNEQFRTAIEKEKRVNQRNNWILFFLVLFAGFTIFFLWSKYKNLRAKNSIKQEALRAQMNPHFISNAINAIESLVNQERNEEASEYLIDFSRLCRQVINHSRDQQITLKEETETLSYFLSLEKLRLADDLDFTISIDHRLDTEKVYVPPLLLQPFVENAIWHGIKNKPEPKQGEVKIEINKIDGKTIEYIIEDNGVGREKSMAIQKESIVDQKSWGTQLTQERINHLKKDLQTSLEIIDLYDAKNRPTGTKVKIQLPIAKKKKKTNV